MGLLSRFHRNAMRFNWMVWHRRLGLITCIGILLWGISGFSHPIMSHLQPAPVAFTPPAQSFDLSGALTVHEVLAAHAIDKVQRIAVVNLDNKPYYRISIDSNQPARYFSLQSGSELKGGDRLYAGMLASHYTGLPLDSISNSRLITKFSDDYHAVNRLLPVWRIEFAGNSHLRAFIDTDQSRLSTLVDDTRYNLTRLFSLGHNWSFADDAPFLQLSIMTLVLGIALFSACSGLYLFFKRGRNAKERLTNNPIKRWHRRLGLAVALSTLLFASSGAFHLVMSFKQARDAIEVAAPETILTSQLSGKVWQRLALEPVAKLDLISNAGKPMWLIHRAGATMPHAQVGVLAQAHDHHGHENHHTPDEVPEVLLLAADGTESDSPGIMQLAEVQAASYAGLPIRDIVKTDLIAQFGDEYGFIFKRLPVVRVQFTAPGNPRYYIEPATGVLASKVEDIDALEGFTFAYFHKWNFGEINKDFRDVLVMLFALGNIIVALMGAILFSRRS